MKKQILGLVVALVVGVAAQASQVNWSFSTSATFKGCTVYSLLASSGTASFSTDFAGIQYASLVSSSLGSATVAGSRSYVAQGTAVFSTDDSKDGTAYYYLVLVSSDNSSYYATAVQTGSAYTPNASATTTIAFTGNSITAADMSSFSAVPEPASVGLLMLGLCALGLKRKIA